MKVDNQKVLKTIKQVFVNEEKYLFDKHVWEFNDKDKFLGDSYAFTIVEKTNPPTFYYVISPFDEQSKKAPQQALVFKNGKLILSKDFTEYAAMRTGAMDALVFRSLGIKKLADKKILMFGRGKTAKWSMVFLKSEYSDLPTVTVVHSNTPPNSYDISEYDIIVCHTNSKTPVLKKEDKKKIKEGAIIMNYISTKPNEIDSSFFDSTIANLVVDWKPNLERIDEIKNKNNVMFLRDILSGNKKLDTNKQYTVFRFLGTPLQNLAILKVLTDNKI